MKRLVFYLLVLIVAVLLGLAIAAHSSYVFIDFGTWTIQTSLWFVVVVLSIVFLVLHYFIRLLLGIGKTYKSWQFWKQNRRINRANYLQRKAVFRFIEDDWNNSELYAAKAAEDSHFPVLSYLLAAFSADKQKAYNRRDHYIAKARVKKPELEIPIEIFLAKLQIQADQLELAKARLEYLHRIVPKNSFILGLLKDIYEKLEEWLLLLKLLPNIKAARLLGNREYLQFCAKVYRNVLEQEYDPERLKQIRKQIPRKVKKLI